MKKRHIIAISCLTLLGVSAVLAQNVEGLDLTAIQARADGAMADAQALAEEVRHRGDAFREEVAQTAERGGANMQRTAASGVLSGSKGLVDFDEMIKGARANLADAGAAPQFIVFASLSMPAPSLKTLISDTGRAGGVVVFRGFPDNSMKHFATAIGKLVEDKADFKSVGVDPRLFRAFNVEAVPAYVAVSSDFDLCDGFTCQTRTPPFDVISGNVTVEYALATFVDGQGPGAAVARTALAHLKRVK